MKILKLAPCLKEIIWGGTKLITKYKMETDLKNVAEAWVLSAHKGNESTVSNGEYTGFTLSEAIDRMGKECLGINGEKFTYFPILIKLIDAKDRLSVQVHPDDEFALKNEGEYGKTEMWYIVDCDEGAELYFGFKEKISKKEFEERIKNNTLTEVLNNVPVKKGDVFFIPSGTVHAIGAGILIAEIQQNSNTTYRIYDYGRVGADNKPRELHIEKALKTAVLDKPHPQKTYTGGTLAESDYFKVKKFEVKERLKLSVDEKSFSSILVLEGKLSADGVEFSAGECGFIPANSGEIIISGNGTFIESRV